MTHNKRHLALGRRVLQNVVDFVELRGDVVALRVDVEQRTELLRVGASRARIDRFVELQQALADRRNGFRRLAVKRNVERERRVDAAVFADDAHGLCE